MAEVEFEVEGKSFSDIIAVAAPHMLCDKVLFSTPIPKKEAKQLLPKACDSKVEMVIESESTVSEKDSVVHVGSSDVLAVTIRKQAKEAAKRDADDLVEDQTSVCVQPILVSVSPPSVTDTLPSDGGVCDESREVDRVE